MNPSFPPLVRLLYIGPERGQTEKNKGGAVT